MAVIPASGGFNVLRCMGVLGQTMEGASLFHPTEQCVMLSEAKHPVETIREQARSNLFQSSLEDGQIKIKMVKPSAANIQEMRGPS